MARRKLLSLFRVLDIVIRNTRPVLNDFYNDSFNSEGSNLNGFVKWKDLTDLTLKIREKKGFPYPEYGMLINTSKLVTGFRINKVSQFKLRISNTVDYAKKQNDEREFMYPSPKLIDFITNSLDTEIEKQLEANINALY